MKKLSKITKQQISSRGVQSLADKPNMAAQYGQSGMSALQLKLWFDQLATYIADKFNEIVTMFSADDAAEYIRIKLDAYTVGDLGALVNAFTSGKFARDILKAYPSAGATELNNLQAILNKVAKDISDNHEAILGLADSKLSKVTSKASYMRAYVINPDGSQTTLYISDTPTYFRIPLYSEGGRLNVAIPVNQGEAANKKYTDDQDKMLASNVDLSIDQNTYVMTLKLKNTEGTVLSTAQIDFPLESMILGGSYADGILTLRIKNNEGHIDENQINIDISHIIDGLVNTATFNSGVATLNGRIDTTNNALQAFIQEIALKEIYAHAAFHAEESEQARNFTKGGGIDKRFRDLEAVGGTSLSVSMDGDYKITVSLKNNKGEVVSSGMVDLPIESLITSASYANKILTLSFQSGEKLNINISDIVSGLVVATRKVNGKTLESDITLTATDVGAYSKSETYSKTEVQNIVSEAKKVLSEDIENHQVVGYSYNSVEAEKASGYTKGGAIDKKFQELSAEINALKNS